MMRNPSSLRWGGFRCADIHSAIHLHGIRGDDFSTKLLGQEESNVGFANRGWPREEKGLQIARYGRRSRHKSGRAFLGRANAATRQCPEQKQSGTQDDNADQMSRGEHTTHEALVLRVIAAKGFNKGAEQSVAHQVGPKNLTVELFTTEQPDQTSVKNKVKERFIKFR